jgi:rRNA maturation protein Rpf1
MKNLFFKTIITTSISFEKKNLNVVKDFIRIFPCSKFFKRKKYKIRQIISYCKIKKIENLIVLVKKGDQIFLWQIDLKTGFITAYKIVSLILSLNIDKSGKETKHTPELIFRNFKGKIGLTISSMIRKLFPGYPNFKGRQVITFYFRKKLIFSRFHRYLFSSSGKDVKIQELGPRITIKFIGIFFYK